MRHDDACRNALSRHLASFTPADPLPLSEGMRHAAVGLIVAAGEQGEAALLLTRRAAKLKAHAGQWALPGGRIDPGETPAEAALREAREEIGLALGADAVIGRLDDYATRSGFVITPLVAWAPADAAMTANPDEVQALYRIPLAELAADQAEFFSIPESERPVIRLPLRGRHVHAPTAAILWQFIEVALHGRATRVAHLEQPVWAWR